MYALLLAGCTAGRNEPPPDSAGDTGRGDSITTSEYYSDSAQTPGPLDGGPGCLVHTTWNVDADGDGFGGTEVQVCGVRPPANATQDHSDCDDAKDWVYPGAPGRYTSGRSEDCGASWSADAIDQLPSLGIYHDSTTQSLGYGVAMPGDVTGDGFPDLAITSKNGYNLGGGVQIYRGPLEASVAVLNDLDASATQLYGGYFDFVEEVANAGDVDGDGNLDLLCGGYQGNGLPGVVYLVRGPLPSGAVSLPDSASMFTGLYEESYLGQVVGVGDVNGDALDDIVLGAGHGDHETDQGEVYLLHGPVPQTSLADAETTLYGAEDENIGVFLAALGDATGDGVPDFATTASYRHVYIVSEAPAGRVAIADAAVDVSLDSYWSPVVSAIGDVTGDGYADVGIGTVNEGTFRILAGPVPASGDLDLVANTATTLRSNGARYGSGLAWATSLGDWDGDGNDDLAVTDTYYTPDAALDFCDEFEESGCNPGALFLLAGPITAASIDLDDGADRVENSVYWANGSGFGEGALAGGSDLDGDGFPDLVIGDNASNLAWVLFGGGQI